MLTASGYQMRRVAYATLPSEAARADEDAAEEDAGSGNGADGEDFEESA